MGFTEEPLPASTHACIVFEDDAERRRIVSEYLAAGVQHGEVVSYISDGTSQEAIRSWMAGAGVDVSAAEARGAFNILPAQAVYCPAGRFEPEVMFGGLQRRYAAAAGAGFTGSRVSAEMSWALRGIPGSDRLLEYEALLNTIPGTFPHCGMCQYDARRFDGATLFKVLQVHPFLVAHGQIVRNPDYVRPEEFLARLRSGPALPSGSSA